MAKNGRKELTSETIRVRGVDIPVKRQMYKQIDLNFYPENPRLYSVMHTDGQAPVQDEIFKILQKLPHVRQLVKSIELNEGLIEPILVRAGDWVVLEGNSRLAAYRILASLEPIKWGEILCQILPDDIDDSVVFSLLGEFHIIGKKDWAKFEQAGYLYRRNKLHDVSIVDLNTEVGLSKNEISHLINVHQYMIDVEEKDINKWSYYDSFLRSRKLTNAVKKYNGLEKKIVGMIKGGEFPSAADLRDNMPIVVEGGDKLLKKFIKSDIDFEEALERARSKGGKKNIVKRVRKFREWVCDVEVADDLGKLGKELKGECSYEINRIQRRLKALSKIL